MSASTIVNRITQITVRRIFCFSRFISSFLPPDEFDIMRTLNANFLPVQSEDRYPDKVRTISLQVDLQALEIVNSRCMIFHVRCQMPDARFD